MRRAIEDKERATQYRVRERAIEYPGRDSWRRAEPGEIVDDIPAVSAKWLLEQGWIEPVDSRKE